MIDLLLNLLIAIVILAFWTVLMASVYSAVYTMTMHELHANNDQGEPYHVETGTRSEKEQESEVRSGISDR